ncbi:MAG: hypothetical protein WA919_15105 [Coleofasciculaceae cyanobacterium]
MSKSSLPVKRQPTRQKSRLNGCLISLFTVVALIATCTLIAGGIRLGILMMIDPDAVFLPERFWPSWTRIPVNQASPPQTLATIRDELNSLGLMAGKPLPLKSELLLPVLKSSSNCQTNCQRIVELRVYQPIKQRGNEKVYQLVNQLTITEPEEYFVLSTLVSVESDNATSSRSLPLTKITSIDMESPAEGIWFNLSGELIGEDSPLLYGQVINYNPDQMHLSVMLEWTNPKQLLPYWQQVTGESTPELVIDQTVGLEPQFKVYRLQPRSFVPNPIYLEEISLVQPALESLTYRQALMLAQGGLWSPAWQWLQSQKAANWSAGAQAQMDLIGLHAQFTKSKAEQAWASPAQQILASLIDGRWSDALLVFKESATVTPLQGIAKLLNTDNEKLWERVEVALKVNPTDINVKAWGALILAAQQNSNKAERSPNRDPVTWLQQLPQTKPTDIYEIYQLLDSLYAALPQTSPTSSHLSQIVGASHLVTDINPADWLQPQLRAAEPQLAIGNNQIDGVPINNISSPTLEKEAEQVWYQVQVAAFNDGRRWWQLPFDNLQLEAISPGKQLWKKLGLDTDARIQITVWESNSIQESIMATVKGVSFQGGQLQLLAAGRPLPSLTTANNSNVPNQPLAHTDAALRWLQPPSLSLSELNNLQPQLLSVILPGLWSELSGNSQVLPEQIPSQTEIVQAIGHWAAQSIDLTGDSEPELILRVYEDNLVTLLQSNLATNLREIRNWQPNRPRPTRTLIFSPTGSLLYSEFSTDRSSSLSAIADLGDGGPTALVINEPNNYRLRRWSTQRQRFE